MKLKTSTEEKISLGEWIFAGTHFTVNLVYILLYTNFWSFFVAKTILAFDIAYVFLWFPIPILIGITSLVALFTISAIITVILSVICQSTYNYFKQEKEKEKLLEKIKDKPMKLMHIRHISDIPENFSGIVKIDNKDNFIFHNYEIYLSGGKKHRIDGPAVSSPFGVSEYWINGVNYEQKEVEALHDFFKLNELKS